MKPRRIRIGSSRARWLDEEGDENDGSAPEGSADGDDADATDTSSSGSSSSSSSSTSYYHGYWGSLTDQVTENSDFDTSNLIKADDVSVNEVVTSFYFNAVVFCLLMCFYEGMRRLLPAVYSSRRKRHYQSMGAHGHHRHHKIVTLPPPYPLPERPEPTSPYHLPPPGSKLPPLTPPPSTPQPSHTLDTSLNSAASEDQGANALPEDRPLDWILSAHSVLFGVSWTQVRQLAGLDGYFFLRYIRMNVRITAVSTVWFFALLIPLYASGNQVELYANAANAATAAGQSSTMYTATITSGWYHLSAANIPDYSPKMWVPCIFLYLFTGFIFFVVKQEYRHYLEIRQDFLAKGTIHVHPQHHYSVMVENIPQAIRSDRALAAYFDKIFPHTVHSAVMVWKLPLLEAASRKCYRSCRRLEKSLAYWNASQATTRPTHIVGRGRVSILGIDLAPLECAQPCATALALDEDEEDDTCPTPVTSNYTVLGDGIIETVPAVAAATDASLDAKGTLRTNTLGGLTASTTSAHASVRRTKPAKGTRVDSIAYYTQELAAHSRNLFRMQQRHAALIAKRHSSADVDQGIATSNSNTTLLDQEKSYRYPTPHKETGTNDNPQQPVVSGGNPIANLVDRVVREASEAANQIMDDSVIDNALVSPSDAYYYDNEDFVSYDDDEPPRHATTPVTPSLYGSISPPTSAARLHGDGLTVLDPIKENDEQAIPLSEQQQRARLMKRRVYARHPSEADDPNDTEVCGPDDAEYYDDKPYFDEGSETSDYAVPFATNQYRNPVRRVLGRLGLDFFVSVLRWCMKQVQLSLEGVVGESTPISKTGFVTFLDLASTTCAASAPLTVKAGVLNVTMAPEPREIIWENAHISKKVMLRRESVANVFLFLGAILWSFPLAAIQAFAKAENLAQIPGLEWITQAHGGSFTKFVNGYLPVVGFVTLISILPIIFELVAVKYERRKTLSDVQSSMLGRYFYYQLANIYVTVTAGSIIKSMAEIVNEPASILELLGQSLPTMVGWFVSLFVTKILAGLPMVYLRFGALLRMLFLRILSSEKKLTQRELDSVYRLENVQYGWEFPTQLLCVVIVFTYAVICPIILPFGFVYFVGALIVYKKQILYVYSPVYESGGAMFPLAVQRSLFGLVCAQLTFWGYLVFRKFVYQPLFVVPLPFLTVLGMSFLHRTYAAPSERLSLERARECDRLSSQEEQRRSFRLGQSPDPSVTHLGSPGSTMDHGVEARRSGFDRSKYRQPVLTEVAAEPWPYRRGQAEDPETASVKQQLRQINRNNADRRASGTL